MSIEWIDPPRTRTDELRDRAAAVSRELRLQPGRWARIEKGVARTDHTLSGLLEDAGIEVRHHYENPNDAMFFGSTFDLYARAPEGA